jgi:transposase
MESKTRRDLNGMEQRRRKGMSLLAQGVSQAEVARRCGVSRVTALRWEKQRAAKAGGPAWKRRPLGRRSKLTTGQKEKLEKALKEGAQSHGFLNDLWTLPRVAELIERLTGVRYHPGHVWKLLVRLGWSVQRPTTKAVQRDEEAIARWKKHTWPALKKSPERAANPCFC